MEEIRVQASLDPLGEDTICNIIEAQMASMNPDDTLPELGDLEGDLAGEDGMEVNTQLHVSTNIKRQLQATAP